MNQPSRFDRPSILFLAGLLASALLLSACGGGGGTTPPAASGNPEADRRADMRVNADDGDGKSGQQGTLYERIGGEQTIVDLVNDMTDRVIADPRVNFDRSNVKTNWLGGRYKPWEATPANVERFKVHMVQFLSLATGGSAEYTGRDMTAVHKGMRITNNEFDAMVGDIKTSLDRLGIANREKRDVLAIIETTRKQIVEK